MNEHFDKWWRERRAANGRPFAFVESYALDAWQAATALHLDEIGRLHRLLNTGAVGRPRAWLLEWTHSGEETGERIYDDERHCLLDAEENGGKCKALYALDVVRPLSELRRMQLIGDEFPLPLVDPLVIAKVDSVCLAVELAHGIGA